VPLEIRTLKVEDAEEFVTLRRLALTTDPTAFPWDPDEDPNSKLEVVQERLSSAKPDDGPFILGAFDPHLIGLVGVIRDSQDTVRLWGVYVQPAARRKGIARLLLHKSLQLACGLPGIQEVVLSVSQTEEPAIQLYTTEGFRRSSTDEGSLHMVLELDMRAGKQPAR
jgi:ribosomal protein S18 acetylase RimI-like enzyme